MKTTLKIFIATALGALIGSLVALELNQYLWWLGMLAGGLVGYLSYEFEQVISATKLAFKNIVKVKVKIRIRKETVIARIMGYLVLFTIMCSFLTVVYFMGVDESLMRSVQENFLIVIIDSMIVSLVAYLTYRLMVINDSSEEIRSTLALRDKWKIILHLNPIVLPFYILYEIGKFLFAQRITILKALRKAIIFTFFTMWVYLYKAIKFIFIQIHSDIRIICMVGAAFGAIVGYLLHSPIIGALAGGICGIISFQIVSIRILKLSPKN